MLGIPKIPGGRDAVRTGTGRGLRRHAPPGLRVLHDGRDDPPAVPQVPAAVAGDLYGVAGPQAVGPLHRRPQGIDLAPDRGPVGHATRGIAVPAVVHRHPAAGFGTRSGTGRGAAVLGRARPDLDGALRAPGRQRAVRGADRAAVGSQVQPGGRRGGTQGGVCGANTGVNPPVRVKVHSPATA